MAYRKKELDEAINRDIGERTVGKKDDSPKTQFTVRFTANELAEIEIVAQELHMTRNGAIRFLVFEAIKKRRSI